MPYVSKAAPERALWCKLPEAVAHVVRIDHCAAKQAQQWIRAALADGELWPLRWENPQLIPTMVGSPNAWQPLLPPKGGKHWKKVRIRWSRRQVLDDFFLQEPGAVMEEYKPEWRVLLIDRDALFKLWPAKPLDSPSTNVAAIDDERRKRGRPAAAREQTVARMRDDLQRGSITREELHGMKQDALAERYNVNREPAVAARKIVLSENAGNSGDRFSDK